MHNDFIQIVEVSPRDGLQNINVTIPTHEKIQLIEGLVQAGVTIIEATSFVSPKWVPQMADHQDILRHVLKLSGAKFPVLVPNVKGLENALACGVQDIAVFAAATDTFSQKNIACTIEESLIRYQEVIKEALNHKLNVRGYVSCALGCPYEGEVSPQQVANVASALYDMGCYEISLGDTIGVGTPHKATHMLLTCEKTVPIPNLAVHFHDTYGQAIANIYACINEGVRTIDSSVAGLGGCPYALGASGNVATEDVLYLCQGLHLKTSIDLDKLIEVGYKICTFLNRANLSKVAQAKMAKAIS